MIRRSGLTLLETLAALVLLASLAIAMLGLTSIFSRDLPSRDRAAHWNAAAEALFDLIDESQRTVVDGNVTEPTIVDGKLSFVLGGSRQSIEKQDSRLVVVGDARWRLLLGGVESFEISEPDEQGVATLTVRSVHGDEVLHRMVLP